MTMQTFVDGNGFMRAVPVMTQPTETQSERIQAQVSDHLSQHFHGNLPGQPEEQDFLLAVGFLEHGMDEPAFHCFPIAQSHKYEYSRAQVVAAAKKMRLTPVFVVSDSKS